MRNMEAEGFQQDFIQQIFSQMKGFAEYGFPESHAASFAHITYASSYLKCHYPAAFFTALINSQPMGFYSIHSLIQAAIRSGVHVRPPCVNISLWDCHLETSSDKNKESVFDIRLGLRLIRSLSKKAALHLIEQRSKLKNHKFTI